MLPHKILFFPDEPDGSGSPETDFLLAFLLCSVFKVRAHCLLDSACSRDFPSAVSPSGDHQRVIC